MTETITVHGGRQPTNRVAADTYNPIVGSTADHPIDFPIGTPVAQSTTASATVIPARADDASTASVTGFAAGRAVVGSRVIVQMTGPLHLTTDQWDAITGEVGGLTEGATYFLDAASEGGMTTTAPSADGEIRTPLGIALSAEDFLVQIGAAAAVSGSAIFNSAAMFFGTTTGEGSAGNDYPSSLGIGAAVPFPRDGAATHAPVTRASGSSFTVVDSGVYEISWTVGFVQASQIQISIGGSGVVDTTTLSGANSINSNTVIVALSAGELIELVNPPGNPGALTVQAAGVDLQQAQAPSIVFRRLS